MSGSLVRRLVLRLTVATGLALVATVALLWWQFGNAAAIAVDRGLGDRLALVKAHLALDARGQIVSTLSAEVAAEFGDERFFTVSDAQGMAFVSVPAGHRHSYHPFEPDRTQKPQYFEHSFLDTGENYLGVTERIELGGQAYWLQLVEEVPYWESFLQYSYRIFLHGVGVVLVLHFLGSATLAYTTLSASFAPVGRAAEQAREIVPGRRDIRIGTRDLPSEVVPFAQAIDAALDRLDRALEAEKRFIADAAHELLTPVAVMKAEIEALDDRTLAASLARLAPLAIARGIEVSLSGEAGPVRAMGCPKALASAIGNLVRNAIQHAEGATRIEVVLGPGPRIAVLDDGPGVAPELRARIFDRFHRVPRASGSGTGLGRAIVRHIAEAHGGTVDVAEAPGGKGAAFVIELGAAAVTTA